MTSQSSDIRPWKHVEASLRKIGDRYGTRITRRGCGIPSTNPFTPDVAGVWVLPNNRPVELSYGWSDFSKCYMFGVSTRPDDDLSHACFDYDSVEVLVANINAADPIDRRTTFKPTRK